MDNASSRPVIIGIAGGSGSGKTTVIRRIKEAFEAPAAGSTSSTRAGAACLTVLEHDAYYKDFSGLTAEERKEINYDHPDSLDTELMLEHLQALLRGETIQKPIYDFSQHRRLEETTLLSSAPILIIDGILVLAEKALVSLMDIKLFVDADSDVRLVRRIRRDITERGRSIEDVLHQYETTVRPMYLQFVEPSKRRADVIIPRGGHNAVAVDLVVARIKTLLNNLG